MRGQPIPNPRQEIIDQDDSKHQGAYKKLQELEEAKKRITKLEEEKEAQKIKITTLVSEVDNLKKQKEKDQKEITDLREDVSNFKAAVVAALNGRLELVIAVAVADNAAHNAENAGRRADGQGVRGHENDPEDQAQGQAQTHTNNF